MDVIKTYLNQNSSCPVMKKYSEADVYMPFSKVLAQDHVSSTKKTFIREYINIIYHSVYPMHGVLFMLLRKINLSSCSW